MKRRLGEDCVEVTTWDWFCLQLDLELLVHRCGSGVDVWCEYPDDDDVWIRCHSRDLQPERFAPLGEWTAEDEQEVLENEVNACKNFLGLVLYRFPEIRKGLSLDRHVSYRIYVGQELKLER